MGISDFFRKVRTLLEGEPQADEVYAEDRKPESVRDAEPHRSSDSAARLAERMADVYVDPDSPEEDEDAYFSSDRLYRAEPTDFYDYDEPDDGFDDLGEEDTYIPSAVHVERIEPAQPTAVAAEADESAAPPPLPNRTEVTLRQIEKLSRQLDDQTLREYQMHLIRVKQETGAVSALTALRILHQYLPAADEPTDDTKAYPDISAR